MEITPHVEGEDYDIRIVNGVSQPNRMTVVRTALIVLLVASVALGGLVGPVNADPENLTISAVAIEPDPPAPGEPFTLRTTIENREGGSGSVEVTDVYVRAASGPPDYERVENLGSVGDGQSLTVPLQLSLDQSRNLRVHVVARTADDESIRLEYPVYVTVEEPDDVQLSFSADDAVAGTDTNVTIAVANGDTSPISNLQLKLNGSGVTVRDAERASASVSAGTDREYAYSVRFGSPGEQQLTATLSYSTDEGYRRTIQESLSVNVEEANVDVGLDATIADRGTVDPPVAVELTNFGNVPLTNVILRVSDGDRVVARQQVAEVPAESTRSARVNVSGLEDTTLDVTASYGAGSTSGSVATTLRYRANPGRIELTGIGVEPEGNQLTITGSASNVGLADVSSVIVRVVPTDGVEPVAPNREYFVGTVPPSDFVSFDLTARVDTNVTAIPLEVTYLSSGVERREQLSVPVESRPESDESEAGSSTGLLLPIALGAIVIIGVGFFIYRGWNNRVGD